MNDNVIAGVLVDVLGYPVFSFAVYTLIPVMSLSEVHPWEISVYRKELLH